MKSSLLVAFLAALAALVLAPAAAAQTTPPPAVPLAQGWEFTFDPAGQGLRGGWSKGAWQHDWADVEVPHVFDPNPTDRNFQGTVGWYRLRFATPPTPAGFGWALRFEGARRVARVWLNGKQIGGNANPYQSFTLGASNLRTDGAPN